MADGSLDAGELPGTGISSSHEVAKDLGITQKSAWFMLHRLRLATLQSRSVEIKFGGESGRSDRSEPRRSSAANPKNMHLKRREKAKKGEFHVNKTIGCGIYDRETRQVRAKLIPNIKREVLMKEILEQVTPGSRVFTDCYQGYNGMSERNFIHETVTHIKEYVRGEVHTQAIENFWSLLKRGLRGTYVAVEPFHLERYVDEQVFRYNNRATRDQPAYRCRSFCVGDDANWRQAPYVCRVDR